MRTKNVYYFAVGVCISHKSPCTIKFLLVQCGIWTCAKQKAGVLDKHWTIGGPRRGWAIVCLFTALEEGAAKVGQGSQSPEKPDIIAEVQEFHLLV